MNRDSKEQREREKRKVAALAAVNRLFYASMTPSEAILDLAEVRAQIDDFRKVLRQLGLHAVIPTEPVR